MEEGEGVRRRVKNIGRGRGRVKERQKKKLGGERE
jgi:hypothetical protein